MLPNLPRHHRTVSVVAVNGLNKPVVRPRSILECPEDKPRKSCRPTIYAVNSNVA